MQSVVDRIRKLRALASSSNENEAARARERAEALMQKHGISEDDLADSVIEVVDNQRDDYREFVAGVAAGLQGCAVVCKRDEIGFRGRPAQVRQAVGFYSSALDMYQSSVRGMEKIVAYWLKDLSEAVWKFYFWDGFAEAVYARHPPAREARQKKQNASAREEAEVVRQEVEEMFGAREAAAVSPEEHRQRARAEAEPLRPDPVAIMQENARQLARNVNVSWLADEARRVGVSMGSQVPLRTSDSDFALPEKSR